jgi:hypothetical protein
MENLVTAYAMILNDPDLRQNPVGEAHRSRRGVQATAGSQVLRVWLATTPQVFATRVIRTSRILDSRPASAV